MPITTFADLCTFMHKAIFTHWSCLPKTPNFVITIPADYIALLAERYSKEDFQREIDEWWKAENSTNISKLQFTWISDGGLSANVTMREGGIITSWSLMRHTELIEKLFELHAEYMNTTLIIQVDRKEFETIFNPSTIFEPYMFKVPPSIDRSTIYIGMNFDHYIFRASPIKV